MNELDRVIAETKKAIVGKDSMLRRVLTTILARGHILLEDIPGVGKTTMALAFSRAMGLDYGRVQFTPDVLPSDITGYTVYNKDTGKMVFRQGAVMCNLFLADELNRATSRTQSALLQAMEEQQVTVDGKTYPLPQPFIVIATQNPTGAAGTQLLPDSQLDRFAARMSIGYPSPKAERALLLSRQDGSGLDAVRQVISRQRLVEMQAEAASVYLSQEVAGYIVDLITATRGDQRIIRGASPRATLSVADMARAVAYISGRDFVIPEDVKMVFADSIAHRIVAGSAREAMDTLEHITSAVREPSIRPRAGGAN